MLRLAWRNILHNRVRFIATTAGIAFATFLMLFQGSLLAGFLGAASKLIDSTDSDLWITARGVVCFDFAGPVPKRFVEIAKGIPGVASATRVVTGMALYRTDTGRHQTVALVGAEPNIGAEFPLPYLSPQARTLERDAVVIDASNTELLEVRGVPTTGEINRKRARIMQTVSGFSSFIGSPYAFTSYSDAIDYLGVGPEDAMYILVRLNRGADPGAMKQALQVRLPDVQVWTREEFAERARRYWVTQTGAGAGILTAAVLGFIIGVLVVSQTMYATTMENIEEFATLKALGASTRFVVTVVLAQALTCGLTGTALGLLATFPLVAIMQSAIAWLQMPWFLPLAAAPCVIAMSCLAAIASIRTAVTVDAGRVFRA